MNVPLFTPNRQNQELATELRAACNRVFDAGAFILGSEVEQFERQVAAWHGAPAAVGVSSGTDALLASLMARGIREGDQVIVPAFTFFATAGVVTRLGACPVFVDVCPACFQMTAESFAAAITPQTRAVIPVHLFGHAADIEGIVKVADAHRIAVIEDTAQAMGAEVGGRKVGSFGDFGCLSFFPTKNLGGFGDGGMVLTRNARDAENLRQIRNHGMHPKYHHHHVGGNFRLDALQAALLQVKLPHVNGWLARRAQHAARYQAALSQHPRVGISRVARCDENCSAADCHGDSGMAILLPHVREGQTPAWNQFTLRVTGGRRDALRDYLTAQGVGSEIYYPIPLHQQPCFAFHCPDISLPNAERLAKEVLSLPIFPELSENEVEHVINAVIRWLDAL